MSGDVSNFLEGKAPVSNNIKEGLKHAGYSKDQVREQLEDIQKNSVSVEKKNKRSLNTLFGFKELFDRLAYGFAPTQFITILFFLMGAGAFVVGIIHALRDVLTGFLSSFISEYSKRHYLSKKFISNAGILFGFSFLLIVFGFRLQSIPLYASALIIGSLSVVAYGSLYIRFYEKKLSYERRSHFLRGITHYGLLITLIAFLVSGIIFEYFGLSEQLVTVFNFTFPVSGYFIMFEVAAILFILSGYMLSFVKEEKPEGQSYPFFRFAKEYMHKLRHELRILVKSPAIKLLLVGSSLTNILQSLGASFYGYYVYTLFESQLFGGFMNVAIVFSVAILFSFLGPAVTRFVQLHVGLAPMFVFGSLLSAIMPLVLVFNPYFNAVVASAATMVLGASILGVAHGLLAKKLLREDERSSFFHSITILLAVPFLILVPLGAFIAEYVSFEALFQIIALVFIVVLTPLYLRLVIITQKKRL